MLEGREIAPDRRLSRLVEVLADEEEIVARVVLVPEPAIDLESAQREVDHQRGEAIEVRPVVRRAAPRMLIRAVPDLRRLAAFQLGNPHAVVVDEQEVLAANEDVSVLQVAVRELRALHFLDQPAKPCSKGGEPGGIAEEALDAPIEVLALHPRHLHDRKRAPFDAQAVGQIGEGGALRDALFGQMAGDGRVALGVVGDGPEEAAYRPGVVTLRRPVDHRVSAGGGLRHAEAVLVDLRFLQLGIAERSLRELERLVVVGEVGPGRHYAWSPSASSQEPVSRTSVMSSLRVPSSRACATR